MIFNQLHRNKIKRAIQILAELKVKGYKKVGKEKIKDLEANNDQINYD